MVKDDIKKMQKLLNAGKLDQAREVFINIFKKDWTDEEYGAALTHIMAAYMAASSEIDKRNIKLMKNALHNLEKLDINTKKEIHHNKLARVKKKIREL